MERATELPVERETGLEPAPSAWKADMLAANTTPANPGELLLRPTATSHCAAGSASPRLLAYHSRKRQGATNR